MPHACFRMLAALLLLGAAAALLPPQAEAACFYPLKSTITYYAWIDDSDPGNYSCTQPGEGSFHWGVIGQQTRNCAGQPHAWGDTTSCTEIENKEIELERCPPICQ